MLVIGVGLTLGRTGLLETLTEWAYNAGGRDKPWFSVEDWNWLPEENP